jgi:hypothetical protein
LVELSPAELSAFVLGGLVQGAGLEVGVPTGGDPVDEVGLGEVVLEVDVGPESDEVEVGIMGSVCL